jgi:signal transduction histidine kinase/ligand-binding sensor domain-containing protein
MFARSKCKVSVALAIALAMAPGSARAVDPNQSTTSYIRSTFSVEDGLSSNVVNAIVQTRNGFLWIGTDAGLNRFDGRHFTPIYFRGPGSTPQGIVSSLAEGRNGDLWIGTSAGLVRIPRPALDRFERSLSVFYHPGPGLSDEITWLHFTRDGVLWVGTAAGLYRFAGDRFETAIPGTYIGRIEESADGHLLVVSDQGFIELDGTRVVPHPGLSQRLRVGTGAGAGGQSGIELFYIVQDRSGVPWFRLARRVNGSIERFQRYGVNGELLYRVYEDPQGNLWVYDTDGISRVSGTKLEPVVTGIQIRSISADRDGNLWIGTNGQGLLRFRDRPVRIFSQADGLPNNVPMTVLSKRDGSLWVGSNCNGLSVFDGKRFKTYDEKDGLSNSCVWSLAEGKTGELWVGTWGGGLFRFADGHFVQFTLRQGLADGVVRAITVAHDGSLWIATQNGLSHMVDGQFHNYSTTDGLSSNRVVSVYQDRHGTIWAGTSRGVDRMVGDRFARVLSPHEIFDPRYISLSEDASGEPYALSAPKGIDRIEGNQLVEVNHDLDLLSMVASPRGELWFTGDHGIFRFSAGAFAQKQAGPDNPPDYAWFGKADGMLSTQCSVGAPNMALTPDGKLWVATVQGLAMLDLRHLSFDTSKPRIFVEDVTVGRTRQPAERELVLPPGTHHVELRFDSISLASPEKIRFQYRMDGVDPVWLDADNSLTAVYTNIPIGTHAFRIRASNSAGVWDRSGISFPVTQKPYFYETGWFRLLSGTVCVGVFLLALWVLYQFRLRQLAHKFNLTLEARVNERTRIARELHDTLLQSFQGLMLHFQTGVDLLPGRPVEARKTFEIAIDRADQAIAEGRDAVQGLRSSTVETNDLVPALRALGEELGADDTNQNSADLQVRTQGVPRSLHPILRDEVYRIAAEALRNAFRHAHAERIEVEILYGERWLGLRVRDDGKGIDPKFLGADGRAKHYGLHGMRERAKLVGGTLVVWSRPDSGTEVELSIPASTAYATSPRRSWLSEKFSGKETDVKEAK